MTRSPLYSLAALVLVLAGNFSPLHARNNEKKYPSLLWEITGNGMKKPSYLFGTMHISNKMVFHLSDSFYIGIRNADVVALELNPELWQNDIPRMNRQSEDYQRFVSPYSDDYIHKNSFTAEGFRKSLKMALASEPALNNNLLYRTEQGMDDFEEHTYLDLYIYQTGRKLGKEATGVEQYMQSQRMMMEAYVDMANEKKKNRTRRAEVPTDVMQMLQDAYRNGNLDMLDSLTKLTEESPAYTEKFLYARNEIQARSMDSIMRRQSLFVGVGAAHLPGPRGVIEILRRKGYKLRPIHMQDRDGIQKEDIDTLRVPVRFTLQQAADSMYEVSVPGPLHPLSGTSLYRMDYADMANGSYYLITRIRTHRVFSGNSDRQVLDAVDSMLYEGIPGKIISRKPIMRNGYKGYDITNKTRRGDMQRYQIMVTPYEVLIFKMGGTDNYVHGPEAEQFFGSIKLREEGQKRGYTYSHKDEGFSITFPSEPVKFYNPSAADNEPRLELESVDPATGDAYLLLRKDVFTFRFLEEDSFLANLAAESFLSAKDFDKEIRRTAATYNGYAAVNALKTTTEGQYVHMRAVIQGPHHYLLAVRTRDKEDHFDAFFNSLQCATPAYGSTKDIKDTFLKVAVSTPVALQMDADIGSLVAYSRASSQKTRANNTSYSSNPVYRHANFFAPSSGELIKVDVITYPEYYYAKKPARFWQNEIRSALNDSDMVLQSKDSVRLADGTFGYRLTISDTGSSGIIRKLVLLKGLSLYKVSTVMDGRLPESSFIRSFFASLQPYGQPDKPTVFDSKLDHFFRNYYSKDSVTRERAQDAIASVYFGKEGFPRIMEAISRLRPSDPDYYELKKKFINELGYLNDSDINVAVVAALKDLYQKAGDTTSLQNAVLRSLVRLKTREATVLFRQLLLQDPPVFDNDNDYEQLFTPYRDTLRLAAALFPDLLQLAPIQDFKPPIISLLAQLADSGMIKPAIYEPMLSNMLFDARMTLKKQLSEEEETIRASRKKDDGDDDYSSYTSDNASDTSLGALHDYALLLAPYYDKNPAIPRYFDKLLHSQKGEVRLSTAMLLLKYGKPLPAGIWKELAADERYRSRVYTVLRREHRLDLYPQAYAAQEDLVRSSLKGALGSADTLRFLSKKPATYKGTKGYVYFYKYKKRGDGPWKLAFTGLQPLDEKDYKGDQSLKERDLSISSGTPLNAQIDDHLKRALISARKGGKEFYNTEGSYDQILRRYQGGD